MNNEIKKGAHVEKSEATAAEMEKINLLTLRELTADEVFTFKVAMCDNEADRDFEVFPRDTLDKLAPMYVGKTVICNHSPKAENQVARIYDTEVEEGAGITKNGETYARLIAHCYMIRTDSNKDMIADIEAGIKKEVSVGCAIRSVVCSVCGADRRKSWCEHRHGKSYEGKECYFKLLDPSDAYELSFVAVPAQPNAGVTKSYGADKPDDAPAGKNAEINHDVRLKTIECEIFIEKEKNKHE